MALPISPYNHVFIDFEFVGDINNGAADCRIWGIGAIKSNGSSFMIVCQVPTNRKTHEGCVEITNKYLKEHAAVPFAEGFARFANWVGPQAVLISHNSFRRYCKGSGSSQQHPSWPRARSRPTVS